MDFESILDRDSKFEHLLGEVSPKDSPFEKVLGEIESIHKDPFADLKPAPKISLQSKKYPQSFLGRQMKGMEASLGLSEEEYDTLETEMISQENKDSFMESIGEVATLAGQPYDVAKGAGSFIMAGIPTFLIGIGGAVSEMNKELPQFIAGYSNLLDMADAAERGFTKVGKYMQPGKEKVEDFLEFPRETFKGAFGEPLSELLLGRPEDVDPDLAGEIAMVPMTVAEAPFKAASESEKIKTVAKVAKKLWLDKVFVTEDNIRGALKFAGFFAGLAALHKVYRGKPGVVKDVPKRSVIKDVKEVADKAEKIAETEILIEKTPNEAIKSAQEKILKMEKIQLELEAKKIAEDLKKEADVESVVKKDLKKKGKKVEEVKSDLRTAEERQAKIEKVFKEEVKKAPEKKVEPSKPSPKTEPKMSKDIKIIYDEVISELPDYIKKDIDVESIRTAIFPAEHQGEGGKTKITGKLKDPEKYHIILEKGEENIKKTLKHELLHTYVLKHRELVKKEHGMFGDEKAVELLEKELTPEPITPLDRQTGVSIPEFEGEKSPFFQNKEETTAFKKVYEERKKSVSEDVEIATQKLINDVNRWYHGDETVDIVKVRNSLRNLASSGDELRMEFLTGTDHLNWLDTVIGAKSSIGYHGTSTKFLPGIEQRGLRPISLKQIVENVLDELNLKGKEREEVRKTIESYDYFEYSIKEGEGARPYDKPDLYIAKDIESARGYAEWAGEAYDNALIAAGAFDKPGGKFNRAVSKDIAKKVKSLYEKNRAAEPVVLEVEVPGGLKKGDNIYRDQLKYKVVEPLRLIKKRREGIELFTGIDPTQVKKLIKSIKPKWDRDSQSWKFDVRGMLQEIYKDPESGWWMDAQRLTPGTNRPLYLGDTKIEAIKKSTELAIESIRDLPGVQLYSGLPLDKASKLIIEGAKRAKEYMDDARHAKRIRPFRAAKIGYEAAIRELVDKSGNIKWDFIDKLGLKGYEIVQKLVLTKGANTIAANKLKQMQREVYGGLSRNEKNVLDNLINWPIHKKSGKQLTPSDAISYIETFAQLEGITSKRASIIRRRVKGYFEWMKTPLDDMLKAELIPKSEYDDLIKHKYRRIKLVDIFDKKYESKRGRKPLTVYDSGVQELARGRKTDIYEPSSEIMALEVFNRAYGRIMRQEANKALLGLSKSDPKNPFVRSKDGKEGIPSGWQRIFVFDKGERKALYISPKMSKEWLTSSSELPYKYGRFIQYISGSAVLRTFATGIEWGFAMANIPRDVMHIYYAARVWEDGQWKSAYSPHLPIFLPQIGMDIARVFPDVVVRGKKTQNYFDYGGGMEFLVHQGLMLRKGKHLEPGLAKPLKALSWFGETSELTTRVAIKEHMIRRRAREKGITVEEARKDKDIQREASFVARDYMDFGQGGGITKAADNAMPYLNAAVQATRGLWRTAKDNPKEFAYKTAEIGLATTLIYSAMREQCPETAKALQGSMALQNNLCIPVGDNFGFEDEKGQTRYWGFKVPLDPSQRFFKTFFEAAYDKSMGYDVDVDRVTNNMLELSPVGVSSMSPTVSGAIGYLYNKDLWRDEDVWKKTKPFSYGLTVDGKWVGRSEEYDKDTHEFFKDIGKPTKISPKGAQFVAGELFTNNSTWAYLMGKGP